MKDLENLGHTDVQAKKAKLVEFINSKEYSPMTPDDMIFLLDVPPRDVDLFRRLLDEIVDEGGAFFSRKNRVLSLEQADLVTGIYERHPRGFGFVILGDGEDIFISGSFSGAAIHGDRVLCRVTERRRTRSEGVIERVLQRKRRTVVGTYRDGFVMPTDKRLPKVSVVRRDRHKIKSGQTVMLNLTKGLKETEHSGSIAEVLGNMHDIGMDVLTIVLGHEIPHEFPKNVLKAADETPEVVTDADMKGRRDFRDLLTVTIDGSDTKDIDDAVSIEMLDNGIFRLYVHIADVNHYVPVGSAMWKEALRRGTSVYLADRVIPMLPKRLSNGICSLNPRVDRLALTCMMDFDAKGDVVNHEICESVIHSNDAVTYENLADMLENPKSSHIVQYAEYMPMFQNMEKLAKILKERRLKQGAMEFDFPEAKIVVDAHGRAIDVVKRDRSTATSIIEEFMVAANEVVSTEYHWLDMPFIYRTHEEPDREKIEALMSFISNFGYSLRGTVARTKSLQNLLERIEGKPEAMLISKQVLRSMKQARYASVALGHFGLAKQFYSHFTSPIRRFPDLAIHAIIKANIAGRINAKSIKEFTNKLPDICIKCSENERRADAAQRDVEDLKKVEYMADKVGQSFKGIISHVTGRGFFVELPNTVEGFVDASTLMDDFYVFFEGQSAMVGERTGKTFRIGDAVKIIVTKADMDMRRLDFEIHDKKRKG
ncbi:MAG: ribonuclease R [Defluviitaleaceae bacterium]|nr:ribonuclease R [Defluviitaleaceae bacterium]